MSEAPELLPLGSAVEIEDDDGCFVIIARGLQKLDDGFSAGYKGIPHPQGAASGVREIVIRESQITKVLHLGYESDKDAVFAKELLEKAKTPPKKPAVSAVEPDLTIDVSKPATVSPSVVAPGAGSAVEGLAAAVVVADPTDPFKELRDKGKQI